MRSIVRITLLATALLAFVVAGPLETKPLAAQSAPTQPSKVEIDANSAAETEIKAVEMKLADLIVRGNWDEFEKHLSSDYSLIAATGKLKNKEEVMSDFRTGPRKIIVMEPEDLRARIHGTTAVLQGQVTTSVRESGHVNTRHERFTEVFANEDGEWRLVAEQQTATAK